VFRRILLSRVQFAILCRDVSPSCVDSYEGRVWPKHDVEFTWKTELSGDIYISYTHTYTHRVPGGKVDILVGHSFGHSKQKKCIVCTCVLFRTVSETELFHCTVHCTLYSRATRHVLTRVAKCIDIDGGIFETVLY
jgi:hypothetical protein